MIGRILPPYTSMQELNLDWILTKVKNILRFVPDDGAVGQILRRTAHGAEWSNEQGGGGAVDSVNGQTGTVVLTASDVGALPDTYSAPVDSVNGQTGTVVLSIPTDTGDLTNGAGFVDAAGAASAAPVQSVNGQTGAVSLSIPDSTSDLVNDSGFVNAAGAASAAPVQSVNGQTGAVSLTIPSDSFSVGDQIDWSGLTIAGWTNSSGTATLVGVYLPKTAPSTPHVASSTTIEAYGTGGGRAATLTGISVSGGNTVVLGFSFASPFQPGIAVTIRFNTFIIEF